jgi:hypothetical protein
MSFFFVEQSCRIIIPESSGIVSKALRKAGINLQGKTFRLMGLQSRFLYNKLYLINSLNDKLPALIFRLSSAPSGSSGNTGAFFKQIERAR